MGDLVRGNGSNVLLDIDRALFLVSQQVGFAKGDTTNILHGTRREIRQADQVQLPVGILDPEILIVVADDILSRIESELPHFLLSRCAVDANRDAVRRAFDIVEVAHD